MALAAFVPSILCDTSGYREKAGLERRIDRFCSRVPSTTPLEQLCEKSCGIGYTQCTNYYTCFNPGLGQVCCPDGRKLTQCGDKRYLQAKLTMRQDYCDAGEYCAQDSSGSQICCKHGEPCNDIATSLSTVSGGYLTVSPISSSSASETSSKSSESSLDVTTTSSSSVESPVDTTTVSPSAFESSASATTTKACTSKHPVNNTTFSSNR